MQQSLTSSCQMDLWCQAIHMPTLKLMHRQPSQVGSCQPPWQHVSCFSALPSRPCYKYSFHRITHQLPVEAGICLSTSSLPATCACQCHVRPQAFASRLPTCLHLFPPACPLALTAELAAAALAFPIGFDSQGTPAGLQFAAPQGKDGLMLSLALAMEKLLGPMAPPPLVAGCQGCTSNTTAVPVRSCIQQSLSWAAAKAFVNQGCAGHVILIVASLAWG